MGKRFPIILFFLLVSLSISCLAQDKTDDVSLDRQINNLQSFAKLYGYIRFFYPSEKVANFDWDKFAIEGVNNIRYDTSEIQLANDLRKLFSTVAPALKIYNSSMNMKIYRLSDYEDTTLPGLLAWQHYGVWLSDRSNIYESELVYKDIQTGELKNELFNKFPANGEIYKAKLDSTSFCEFPLTLYSNHTVNIHNEHSYELNKSHNISGPNNGNNYDSTDKEVMLADVIITWNVIQHFYPYFDVIDIDWGKVLKVTLKEALLDKDADEFYDTLRKMIAKLQDGHGVVYYKTEPQASLPVRVEWIENQFVVTASLDTAKIKKGDIIDKIDGISADSILQKQEEYISGSSWLKRYRALNLFGSGEEGTIAAVQLKRGKQKITIKINRRRLNANLFFNNVTEFSYPVLKEISKDIYYVNLHSIDEKTFNNNLNKLATAKGIIFDWRPNGIISQQKSINTLKIIKHLIDSTIYSEKWNVPEVIYPDREDMTFQKTQWSLNPSQPHFNGKFVFIDEPSVFSFGETVMGIVDYYKIGTTVGDTTAGTNGNINFIPLPGGYNIMLTGMRVLKNDGSQLELVGFPPDVPVHKTIKAIIEGRDGYLEKAIEIIKDHTTKK